MEVIEPASPLPWRGPLTIERTADGRANICDADDHPLLSVLYPHPHEQSVLNHLVATANAYPRLKEQLDRALEACRWLEAARRLAVAQIVNWSRFTCATYDKCQAKERKCLAQAERLAREALEMEERDRRG